jgi:hypothetical protein
MDLINVDFAPGSLHCVDVGNVSDVSEIYIASIIKAEDCMVSVSVFYRSGHCGEEKNFAPAGNRTPAVQPVTRRYTD